MAIQEIYIAVIGTVEDGEVVGFDIDQAVLHDTLEGVVWDHDTGEWTNETSPALDSAFRRVALAVKELNRTVEELNRKDVS